MSFQQARVYISCSLHHLAGSWVFKPQQAYILLITFLILTSEALHEFALT